MKFTDMPDMVTVKATKLSAPPAWALMERRLMDVMEEAAYVMIDKYTERGGALFYKDALDDLYERFYNWGLFYAMGAGEKILDLAHQQWNAITRYNDDGIVHRQKEYEYTNASRLMDLPQQGHKEWYNAAEPGGAEWHHLGEANMAFYDFGVADPTVSEMVRRSRRFAGFYLGEDPEAPLWDANHKLIRSPVQTSTGPYHHTNLEHTISWLQGDRAPNQRYYGVRASLYPVVKDLEPGWYENPKRAKEIVGLFEKVVLNSDTPNNLGSTALITNAFLYTGDAKYKQWVLDYVEVWMDRITKNNGIIPDNVGPTGKIGENREGVWWGNLYGWNCYSGYNIMFHSLNIAAECAQLLSGDDGYLDLMRSQIKVLMDNAMTREDGQFISPSRYGADGWQYLQWNPTTGREEPFRMQELAHLYHASMSSDDYGLITWVRDNDQMRDWNSFPTDGEKNHGELELSRFQYYDGKNPDWPMKVLNTQYEQVIEDYEKIKNESDDFEVLITENRHPDNPVLTKGLTQLMFGAPQSVYNGGLLRATVRYFDADARRPGLPPDVAALVDELRSDGVGVQLVNTGNEHTRKVVVQAGAFGEHDFTEVVYMDGNGGTARQMVHEKYFAVDLPPSTSIRLDAGLRRFVNQPSYAFPWHGDTIPVPFQ